MAYQLCTQNLRYPCLPPPLVRTKVVCPLLRIIPLFRLHRERDLYSIKDSELVSCSCRDQRNSRGCTAFIVRGGNRAMMVIGCGGRHEVRLASVQL
jgi:hypothetical protein